MRLINDYKACKEYSEELEERLKEARLTITSLKDERIESDSLVFELDNALKGMEQKKHQLNKKLKRTRIIGIIVGVLLGGWLIVK